MSPEEHEFVVRLRKVQWMLDDVAYQVPKNRSGAVDFPALAEALTDLATVVRHRGRNDPVEPTARLVPGLLRCRWRTDCTGVEVDCSRGETAGVVSRRTP